MYWKTRWKYFWIVDSGQASRVSGTCSLAVVKAPSASSIRLASHCVLSKTCQYIVFKHSVAYSSMFPSPSPSSRDTNNNDMHTTYVVADVVCSSSTHTCTARPRIPGPKTNFARVQADTNTYFPSQPRAIQGCIQSWSCHLIAEYVITFSHIVCRTRPGRLPQR